MTAAASTKIQLNFKTPSGTLINLYADNDTQLDAELDAVEARLGRIAALEGLINGAAVVQATFNAPDTQANVTPSQAQAALPPVVAPTPAQVGPACQHGPMVQRHSKPGASRKWTGWFCPTPKGTEGQCEPQFVN